MLTNKRSVSKCFKEENHQLPNITLTVCYFKQLGANESLMKERKKKKNYMERGCASEA